MDFRWQFVDAYSPETVEIGSRLDPFVPDYVPTIGLPFDGIQVRFTMSVVSLVRDVADSDADNVSHTHYGGRFRDPTARSTLRSGCKC